MSRSNCVVVLVDESSAMSSVMRDRLADGSESTKTNAARVATSINSLLRQLAEGPSCDVAVVGYRSDADGQANVGCRWPDTMSGREFVSSGELLGAARNETRTRRVQQPDGSLREEQVHFPVWYEPVLGSKGPQVAAFRFCRDLVDRWRTAAAANAGHPLVLHIFSGASADGSPQIVVDEILRTSDSDGKPIIVQCHMAASSSLVTTAFPSKQAYLASGMARDLFTRASELPHSMLEVLKTSRVKVQSTARAFVHNAKIADLFHCTQLAKQHVSANGGGPASVTPPSPSAVPAEGPPVSTDSQGTSAVPAAPPSGEAVGLAVLVLDRSVADPFGGTLINPCSRLQEAGNEILKQLSNKQYLDLAIDTAILSYGQGSDGQQDVRSTFDGPLSGRAVVRNNELPSGAIRVEEMETQVSNGVGGLVTVTEKTPIYFDVESTAEASPHAAFAAAGGIIGDWITQHPTGMQPILLHLTRAAQDPAEMTAAIAVVSSLQTSAGPVLIHHLVFTETPHKALAYPDGPTDIDGEKLKVLWETSSPLLNWERLKEDKRPYLTERSRGFVVNGKFDAIADEFAHALVPAS
jgi:hypothetical protein